MKARIALLTLLATTSLLVTIPVGCAGRNGFLTLIGMGEPEGVDKARLRELVRLPLASVFVGIKPSRRDGGFALPSDETDAVAEIAALRKAMTGDASDAERYFRLWELSADKEINRKTRERAVELFREQLNAQPTNARIMAKLGKALTAKETNEEAEKLLRQAVALVPSEAASWSGLGECLQEKAVLALGDGSEGSPTSESPFMPLARKGAFSAERAAAAAKLLDEALQCHNQAVSLAPGEAEPYKCRAIFWCLRDGMRPALRFVQGDKGEFPAHSPEWVADYRAVARLCPNDPRAIAVSIWAECICFSQENPVSLLSEPGKFWKSLPPSTRAEMTENIAQLGKISNARDKQIAARAFEVRAMIMFLIVDDRLTAEQDLRFAVALDPTREQPWYLLRLGFFGPKSTVPESKANQMAVCQDRIKHSDTANSRFMLAYTYWEIGQFDKAEEQLRLAVRKEPDNFKANLGLAAVRLKLGKDETSLQEVARLLDQSRRAIGEETSEDHRIDYNFNRSIYLGLVGNVHAAKNLINYHLARDPNDKQARDVLSALGK